MAETLEPSWDYIQNVNMNINKILKLISKWKTELIFIEVNSPNAKSDCVRYDKNWNNNHQICS